MSDYAPNPKKQLVYDNLQTKTLADVTALDIQRLTDPTFIQSSNQDALITYNIVNKAAMRDGNAMPLGGGISLLDQTGDDDYQDIRPPKGQVWSIQSMSVKNSATPTGSNTYFIYWVTTTTSGLTGAVYHSAMSSSSTHIPCEALWEENFHPIHVSYNSWMRVYSNMDNVQVGATVQWQTAFQNTR